MSLTAAEVAEIMRLIEHSRFDELSLDMDGVKLTLRRAGAHQAIVAPTGAARPDGAVVPAPLEAGPGDITSPMLGTFYRAPKPGSAPYVDIGAHVEPDTVIAIIEVMKLMNTVRAGLKGTIVAILPADETLVEFGQVLMRVRRDE